MLKGQRLVISRERRQRVRVFSSDLFPFIITPSTGLVIILMALGHICTYIGILFSHSVCCVV
jgi:hypothetical protein